MGKRINKIKSNIRKFGIQVLKERIKVTNKKEIYNIVNNISAKKKKNIRKKQRRVKDLLPKINININKNSLRNYKKTYDKISKTIDKLKKNYDKESYSIEDIIVSDEDEFTDNDFNIDQFFKSNLTKNGNNIFNDPFYCFMRYETTFRFLLVTKNNIVTATNYDTLSDRILQEAKTHWTVDQLLSKIFKYLYEELKMKRIKFLESYFDNFIYKWSLFIKDEIDKYNCRGFSKNKNYLYTNKENTLKRINKKRNRYYIRNRKLYSYVMKKMLSFFWQDDKWELYYYYLFLIPKNILLIYYCFLKERHSKFQYVLSDLKEFITLVLRCGGIRSYCNLINNLFVEEYDKNFGYLHDFSEESSSI